MENVERWDYLTTLRPPSSLSIESGKIHQLETLGAGCSDYQFVSELFLSTFGLNNGFNYPFNPAIQNSMPPGPFSSFFGNVPAYPPQIGGGIPNPRLNRQKRLQQTGVRITKIEKVQNCVIYERFMNEFKRMLKKYPQMQITDMMMHLFHGCK